MNEQANHMSGQEKAIQDFMQNCLVMRKEEQIIDNMLTELGKHYDADSVSVFEVNEASTHISNVRQWYRRGVMPKAANQQNIALDELKQWLAWFQEQGTFFLSAASGEGNPEAGRTRQISCCCPLQLQSAIVRLPADAGRMQSWKNPRRR